MSVASRLPDSKEIERLWCLARDRQLDEDALTLFAEGLWLRCERPLGMFAELEQRHPDDLEVRCAHARFLLDTWGGARPADLVDLICRKRPFHPLARAVRGSRLMDESPATEARGEGMLRDAIRAAPHLVHPRVLLAEALRSRGRAEEALTLLDDRDRRGPVVECNAFTLLALDRLHDARALVEAYNLRVVGSQRSTGLALRTRHEVNLALGNLDAAQEVCRTLGPLYGEDPDNGRLEAWETELFHCLVRKGELAAAAEWAARVAVDARDVGFLAHHAVGYGACALGRELAGRALARDPENGSAGLANALLLEIDGDLAGAIVYWSENDGAISSANLSRVALGSGEPGAALRHAEDACAHDHLMHFCHLARAQAKLVLGDADGARADAARSWQLVRPGVRAEPRFEVRATRALAEGDRATAEELLGEKLRGPAPVSDVDRARILRLLNVDVSAAPQAAETSDDEGVGSPASPLPPHESTFVVHFL